MIESNCTPLLTGLGKKACFITLGCKVNQYESDVMAAAFRKAGYQTVDREDKDVGVNDVYVINSCTVTSTGDKKTRQILHRCRRENPNAVIALTGCFVQAFPQRAEELSDWDVLCGNTARRELLELVERAALQKTRIVKIDRHERGEKFEDMELPMSQHKTRAFVKIEDGCNRFCSYCIIPYARGRVRSKPIDAIKAEIQKLADAGYREIVLVGINLSSYGQDLGLRLIDAVEACCNVPGVKRVRLGSLEPELLTHEDLARMAKLPQFCAQFHLALQSGSDGVLRRMNRHYDKKEYARIVNDIRDCFENPSVTTDIMTGFPGETEEEHRESMAFAKEIALSQMHVFEYSPREGTPAAKLPQLSPQIKKQRTLEMLAVKKENEANFLLTQLGKTAEVLLESHFTEAAGLLRAEGYTRNYTPVYVDFPADTDPNTLRGKIVTVRLNDIFMGHMVAASIEDQNQ